MKFKHLAFLVALTALLWLLTDALALHLRHAFSPWPQGRDVDIKAEGLKQMTYQPYTSYLPIVSRNLFGEAAKIPPAPPLSKQKIDHIPIAQRELPIALMGVIASGYLGEFGDSPENVAILLDKKTNLEGFHKKGDTIHGYTILRVLPQAVIITKENETLRLLTRISKAYMDIAGISAGPENVVAPAGISVASPETTTRSLSREDIKNSLDDLQDVLNSAAVSSYSGPTGKGLRLNNMKPNSIYSQLNLQDNDVILSVNGAPLTNAAQAMGLYELLNTAKEVNVVIMRNNKMLNHHYVIK